MGEGGWRHQYLYCFLEYLQNEVEAMKTKLLFLPIKSAVLYYYEGTRADYELIA